MPKKYTWLCLCLLLSLLFSLPASAHSGKTDSNGGHYDSDTGTYHYHHGYPAHMHYDMDGDGYRDCPYDFDDQTGVNSGSSSSSGGSSSYTPLSYSDGYADGHEDGYDEGYDDGYSEGRKKGQADGYDEGYSEGKEPPTGWVVFLALVLFAVCIAFYVVNRRKAEKISILEYDRSFLIKQHERKIEDLFAAASDLDSLREEIAIKTRELNKLNVELALENRNIQEAKIKRNRIQNAPPGITFSDDGKPICWRPVVYKPYGDYTVYVNKTGTIYHSDRFCASCSASVRHIFDVINHARPCERCAKEVFDFTAVPDWYKPDGS